MDTTEADSKMSLWGEFDVAEEPSKANDAPSPYIHQFSNVQPKSTSLNTSEKVKTLSTECNSKEDFFTHLLRLDSAHFASQQRGDPDFTDAEGTKMAKALLGKSPAAFLTRFGKALGPSHLAFFEEQFSNGDKEVLHRLKRLRHGASSSTRRNRRLRAIQSRLSATKKPSSGAVGDGDSLPEDDDDSYFSVGAMRARNPALYHEMVGRHLTEAEEVAGGDSGGKQQADTDCTLSSIILNHVDLDRRRKARAEQERECEDCEEFEDDDDNGEQQQESQQKKQEEKEEDEIAKKLRMAEFARAMKESFVDGRDADFFDYAEVDGDSDLDDLDEEDRDAEERYFDDD